MSMPTPLVSNNSKSISPLSFVVAVGWLCASTSIGIATTPTRGDQRSPLLAVASDNVLLELELQAITSSLNGNSNELDGQTIQADILSFRRLPSSPIPFVEPSNLPLAGPPKLQLAGEQPLPPLLIFDAVTNSPSQIVTPNVPSKTGFSADDLVPPTAAKGTSTTEDVSEVSSDTKSIEPVEVAVEPPVNRSVTAKLRELFETPQAQESVPTVRRDDLARLKSSELKNSSEDGAGNDEALELKIVPPGSSDAEDPQESGDRFPWVEPPVTMTRQMQALRPQLTRTLQFYFNRPLNTKDDSAWSIMHSLLGYGLNTPVAIAGEKGRRTNGVGWMCWNNPCAGQRLLYLDHGYIKGRQGAGFEGHRGQFLAMLAQIGVQSDHPMHVQGQAFKVQDLVRAEQRTCFADQELTFKIIGISHYVDSDDTWVNDRGESWDIPKMLSIELSQPVNGAACGGTHRIMACSYALKMRQERGEPIDGAYATAQKYVRDYQRYAMSLQNRDGSFSSDWFKSRATWGDKDRQLQTTGHILEWLIFSLPRNELSDPRIVGSVDFLANLMTRHRYYDWEVGPRGHALRALALYQQRVFTTPNHSAPLARRATVTAQ